MARYRGILRAAVALVLLLPAARQADAQDTLIVDSGGARWRSGENRKPAVTVDHGIIDTLVADRRPTAARRQYRRPRRYLTLNIPQSDTPLLLGRTPLTAAPSAKLPPANIPAAKLPPDTQTPPVRARIPEPPSKPLAAAPKADPPPKVQTPPVRARTSEPPAKLSAPPVSEPPSRPAALLAQRQPAGKVDATPALRAFLDRAAGKRAPEKGAGPAKAGEATPLYRVASATRERAKLPPPPRPIASGPAAPAAAKATSPKPGTPAPFRLPPPAPETNAPARAALSPAFGARLPPPPPGTGSRTGVLPSGERKAGAAAPQRRRLVFGAASRSSVSTPASSEVRSETFFYEANGTTLGADERERLRGLALKVSGQAGLGVEIRAYSGSVGGDGVEARRMALSRAMEVRRLLIAAGVPDTRILARASGGGEGPAGRVDVILVARS